MEATEYRERVTAELIAAIDAGTAPWQRPWKPCANSWPHNHITKRSYQGINPLVLLAQGYDDPRWMGFGQARKKGAAVRKGEPGTPILRVMPPRTLVDEDGAPLLDERGRERKTRSHVKVLWVWNVTQIDGLDLPALGTVDRTVDWDPVERAETALAGSGVPIRHGGSRAFYSTVDDAIQLPLREQFQTALDYYHVALHELGHATGHPTRLGRDGFDTNGKRPSKEEYAREELIAEIAALMAGEKLGTGSTPRHGAAYVESWIKVLENDTGEIVRAATAADKAASWIVAHSAARMVA